MKHLLIPTDFTVHSLNAIHAAVATHGKEPFKITLFHLLRMPGDIPDLLFPSLRNKHLQMITGEFREACEVLQNRYPSIIASLQVKFGFGTSVAYVRNLLEGEKVHIVFTCPDIQLSLPSPRSMEMISLLKRTGYAIETVPSHTVRKNYSDMKVIDLKELKKNKNILNNTKHATEK